MDHLRSLTTQDCKNLFNIHSFQFVGSPNFYTTETADVISKEDVELGLCGVDIEGSVYFNDGYDWASGLECSNSGGFGHSQICTCLPPNDGT